MSILNNCVVCGKSLLPETQIQCCKECLYKRPGRFIPVTGDPDQFVSEIDFHESNFGYGPILDLIYETGGNPEYIVSTPRRLYAMGWINRWELVWLTLRSWVGILTRNAICGEPFVLRRHGILIEVTSEPTQTRSGILFGVHGEQTPSSSPIRQSLSGFTSPSTTPTASGTKDTSSRGTSAP
jgi:hypothetical protein